MNKFFANIAAVASVFCVTHVAAAAQIQTTADAAASNIRNARDLPPAVSSYDPVPPAPSPVVGRSVHLVRQAGIGGQTAYARAGVLEFGGSLSFSGATDNTVLTVTPQVGHFLTDNLQLSILTNVGYSRVKTAGRSLHKTNVLAVVEPSVHVPVVDQLFLFAGAGVGVAYHQGLGTGVAVAPRIGFNVLVGRSGILTPAFNVNWSSNSAFQRDDGTRLVAVHTTLGASVGYSVMF